MSDLSEFLLARIAEDEEVARAGFAEDFGDHFTPARVLAECDAKRRIVWEHRPESDTQDGIEFYPGALCLTCGALRPCATLRLLAVPYADHPDYRQEWRP